MTSNKMRVLLIYIVILAFLSLKPWLHLGSSPAIGAIAWDKLDHSAAYGGLSVLLMWAYREYRQQWLVSLTVWLAGSMIGLLFEYCQLWFTSSREFSYYDAAANVFGALAGVVLFWGYRFVAVKPVK